MRRVLFILSLFMLVCGCIEARTIIVEIGNIRGNHGNILVMAQSGKDTKPFYGMAKPEKGKVTIRLENVDWKNSIGVRKCTCREMELEWSGIGYFYSPG